MRTPRFSGTYRGYPLFKEDWRIFQDKWLSHCSEQVVVKMLVGRGLCKTASRKIKERNSLEDIWRTLDRSFLQPELAFLEIMDEVTSGGQRLKDDEHFAIGKYYERIQKAGLEAKSNQLEAVLTQHHTVMEMVTLLPPSEKRLWNEHATKFPVAIRPLQWMEFVEDRLIYNMDMFSLLHPINAPEGAGVKRAKAKKPGRMPPPRPPSWRTSVGESASNPRMTLRRGQQRPGAASSPKGDPLGAGEEIANRQVTSRTEGIPLLSSVPAKRMTPSRLPRPTQRLQHCRSASATVVDTSRRESKMVDTHLCSMETAPAAVDNPCRMIEDVDASLHNLEATQMMVDTHPCSMETAPAAVDKPCKKTEEVDASLHNLEATQIRVDTLQAAPTMVDSYHQDLEEMETSPWTLEAAQIREEAVEQQETQLEIPAPLEKIELGSSPWRMLETAFSAVWRVTSTFLKIGARLVPPGGKGGIPFKWILLMIGVLATVAGNGVPCVEQGKMEFHGAVAPTGVEQVQWYQVAFDEEPGAAPHGARQDGVLGDPGGAGDSTKTGECHHWWNTTLEPGTPDCGALERWRSLC